MQFGSGLQPIVYSLFSFFEVLIISDPRACGFGDVPLSGVRSQRQSPLGGSGLTAG